MSSELKRAFDEVRRKESLTLATIMERMAVENPDLSDEDLAALTWKKLFDIEPVEPRSGDAIFQDQVELMRKLRKFLASKEQT